MATVLYRGAGLIEMPSSDKMQLNDDERLDVLKYVNRYRSNVKPPAANMLAVVSQRQVFHHYSGVAVLSGSTLDTPASGIDK